MENRQTLLECLVREVLMDHGCSNVDLQKR